MATQMRGRPTASQVAGRAKGMNERKWRSQVAGTSPIPPNRAREQTRDRQKGRKVTIVVLDLDRTGILASPVHKDEMCPFPAPTTSGTLLSLWVGKGGQLQ